MAPLGHPAHQLGEQVLIATLGGREACFSVPVDTFPHQDMSGQFEMEWPEKLHASGIDRQCSERNCCPGICFVHYDEQFEIPMEAARGIAKRTNVLQTNNHKVVGASQRRDVRKQQPNRANIQDG